MQGAIDMEEGREQHPQTELGRTVPPTPKPQHQGNQSQGAQLPPEYNRRQTEPQEGGWIEGSATDTGRHEATAPTTNGNEDGHQDPM